MIRPNSCYMMHVCVQYVHVHVSAFQMAGMRAGVVGDIKIFTKKTLKYFVLNHLYVF